jgi:hypothetical protein
MLSIYRLISCDNGGVFGARKCRTPSCADLDRNREEPTTKDRSKKGKIR